MHPILISSGPLTIHSYGLMAALGYLAAVLVTLSYRKRENLSAETILDFAIYIIISSLLGARLFYVLGQWDYYTHHLVEIVMVQQGGLVVLGGLIFILLTVIWYGRRRRIAPLKLFDLLAPGTILGLAVGRLGCFLNGCCFGLPAQAPWAVKFPFGSLAYNYFPNDHLHPTQLYSASGLALIFFTLVFIYRGKKYDGQIFYWSLVLYALARFTVEFFRYSPLHWLGLTPSQWLVIILFFYASYNLLKKMYAKPV